VELLHYLQKRYGHISCERVLSGPGIRNIYDFLRDSKKAEEPSSIRDQISAAHDPSALIAQLALQGASPICEQTMALFVSVFGAEAGNCALRYMTTGGIYIGGIIAAKNLEKMKDPAFLQAFFDKGRMGALLKDMPVKVIVNDDCGLIGSARYTLVKKAFAK
jgi:glucokinase